MSSCWSDHRKEDTDESNFDTGGKEIDKKKIQLPEAIKSFGVYEVSVKLHPKVTGKLKVKVTEAK